ncbi:hypothetical protein QOT17_005726 [Balamuthia mandrillaris]
MAALFQWFQRSALVGGTASNQQGTGGGEERRSFFFKQLQGQGRRSGVAMKRQHRWKRRRVSVAAFERRLLRQPGDASRGQLLPLQSSAAMTTLQGVSYVSRLEREVKELRAEVERLNRMLEEEREQKANTQQPLQLHQQQLQHQPTTPTQPTFPAAAPTPPPPPPLHAIITETATTIKSEEEPKPSSQSSSVIITAEVLQSCALKPLSQSDHVVASPTTPCFADTVAQALQKKFKNVIPLSPLEQSPEQSFNWDSWQ